MGDKSIVKRGAKESPKNSPGLKKKKIAEPKQGAKKRKIEPKAGAAPLESEDQKMEEDEDKLQFTVKQHKGKVRDLSAPKPEWDTTTYLITEKYTLFVGKAGVGKKGDYVEYDAIVIHKNDWTDQEGQYHKPFDFKIPATHIYTILNALHEILANSKNVPPPPAALNYISLAKRQDDKKDDTNVAVN